MKAFEGAIFIKENALKKATFTLKSDKYRFYTFVPVSSELYNVKVTGKYDDFTLYVFDDKGNRLDRSDASYKAGKLAAESGVYLEKGKKSLAFNIYFEDVDKTLTLEEITPIFEKEEFIQKLKPKKKIIFDTNTGK